MGKSLIQSLVRCTQCKEEKSLNRFYAHKGHSNGLRSECKECTKLNKRKRIENNPLQRRLNTIRHRCNNPNASDYKWYGGKGVECKLTLPELKYLWKRDEAVKMDYPTIDRIDGNGHYEFDNCRIVEKVFNCSRPKSKKVCYE